MPPLSSHEIIVSGGGDVYTVTSEGSEAFANVTGLYPGTEYTFRVVAVSEFEGVAAGSPESQPLSVTTAFSRKCVYVHIYNYVHS